MGYGKFMQRLEEGIEGKVSGYSKRDGQDGCLIYLKSLTQRIFVPADIIDRRREDVIQVLREKIRSGIRDTPVLVLHDREGNLVFEQEITTPKNVRMHNGVRAPW